MYTAVQIAHLWMSVVYQSWPKDYTDLLIKSINCIHTARCCFPINLIYLTNKPNFCNNINFSPFSNPAVELFTYLESLSKHFGSWLMQSMFKWLLHKPGGLDLSWRGLDWDSRSRHWQRVGFDGWENLNNFKKLVSTIKKSWYCLDTTF